MLSRFFGELGRSIYYALDDNKHTARLCVLLLVVALAAGIAYGVYVRVRN